MALPSNVSYGHVTGKFLRAVADSSDTDLYPDGQPLAGLTIKFTASVTRVKNVTTTPPVTIIIDPIECNTNDNGVLVDGNGNEGVWLIASSDEDLNPTGWTWTATFSASSIASFTTTFTLAPGEEVDLTTLIPVPSSPGTELAAWEAVVAEVAAAQAAAQAARTGAESARDEAVTAREAAQTAASAAQTSEASAATSATSATQARNEAVTARGQAEVARQGAETARDQAAQSAAAAAVSESTAVASAATAQTAASEATTQASAAAVSAAAAAEARDAAQSARTGAESAWDGAVTAQGQAEVARQGAETARDQAAQSAAAAAVSESTAVASAATAQTAASEATTQASAAAVSAAAAAEARDAAQSARTGAETARSEAASSAATLNTWFLRGTGSPVGVITPSSAGVQYVDLAATNGALVWISTGTTSSAWKVVDWEPPTWGWTTLTAINGWTANTGEGTPMVRRDGNIVTFRGGLYGGEAWTQATWLPDWARPDRSQIIITWSGSENRAVPVAIHSNGSMNPGGTVDGWQMCQWTVA